MLHIISDYIVIYSKLGGTADTTVIRPFSGNRLLFFSVNAQLAQQVEQTAVNRWVVGSSPTLSAICLISSVGRANGC